MDVNPGWFRRVTRVFNALAFLGVACALAFAVSLVRRGRAWEAVALSFPLATLAFQIPMHVEGRYSFPAIPLAIFCAVAAAQSALAGTGRARRVGAAVAVALTSLFLFQAAAWDRDDFVMRQIEARGALDPNVNSRSAREERARSTEAAIAETEGLDDSVRLSLGYELYMSSAFEPAVELWSLIDERSASYSKAQGKLAAALIQLKEFGRARKALATAQRLEPSNELYRNNQGWLERAEAEARAGR
jgi:hypothetical protein